MSNIYLWGTKGRAGLHVSGMEAHSTIEAACKAHYQVWGKNKDIISNPGFIYELGVDTGTVKLVTNRERKNVLANLCLV